MAHDEADFDSESFVVHGLGQLAGTEIDVSEHALIFPVWAPDGSRISASGQGLRTIGLVDLDGNTEIYQNPEGTQQFFPSWSPDGQWISFNRRTEALREVWIMRPDGSEPRQIGDHPELDLSHPRWSPADQDKILVDVDHENLAVLSVSTGELTFLTDFNDSTVVIDYPSWSADGSLIHFSLARRRGDVYLMAPEVAAGD